MNQKIFHLPDGPEQAARDRSMRAAMQDALREERGEACAVSSEGNANVWADKTKNRIQFSYDAEAEAERWWNTSGQQQLETLRDFKL
jgi:salicylate hydroxylase